MTAAELVLAKGRDASCAGAGHVFLLSAEREPARGEGLSLSLAGWSAWAAFFRC
jgi:hypothetical protein